MATLKDIALRTGVSVRAVSYAVNGGGHLSPETRARIMEEVKRCGYVPNAAARALVTQKSGLIGVLLPFLDVSFYSQIIAGLERTAQKYGYTLLLMNLPDSSEKYISCYLQMMQHKIDGLIVNPAMMGQKEVEFICNSNIPVVQLMNHVAELGSCYVNVGNFEAGRKAAEALVKSGCSKIAMLSHDSNSPEMSERSAGFSAAMQELVPEYAPVIVDCKVLAADAEKKCLQLLTEHPEIDAVFAASDYAALGAARAALSMGRKIPDEFSIIGFDDISLAADQLLYPFSTIAQPKEEIGWIAGKMMIDLINGKSPDPQTLQASLVLRSTTRNDALTVSPEKK